MNRQLPPARRRNSAPVRPPRPATSVPDFLFALASAGLVMAGVFFTASWTNENVTAGEAGRTLARLFAAALLTASLFTFALGLGLLRAERTRADHYLVPVMLGIVMGGIESVLFLWPATDFLFAPFVLLVFVFRPVRRHLARMVNPGSPLSR